MKSFNLKNTIAASVLGLAAILGMSGSISAQNNRQVQQQQQKVIKQQEKIIKQQQKLTAAQQKTEQERLLLAQRQQNRWNNRNANNNNNNNRYRVYRNGSYYQTDSRGADLLRQAVNRGYQEGVRAGQADRANRRGSNYGISSVYRSGNYGYQSYVDAGQYQYYFRQGFERGYQDGFNSRYQYGNSSGGALNILGTILQGILNIQQS